MATPADQRLLELLDKWLKSLELHLDYASLDDQRYSNIQPWPVHQRPSRWIIDLAHQKAVALQAQVRERIEQGDARFSDALELMSFLANLLGAEHIERFIPLAHADTERSAPEAPEGAAQIGASDAATGTREMPAFVPSTQRAQPLTTPTKTPHATPPAAPRRASSPKPSASSGSAQAAPKAAIPAVPGRAASIERGTSSERNPSSRGAASSERASPDLGFASAATREQVIADAARLVQWGRKWYELAELIAGMADRPSVTDVRRILKDNKAVIDEKAGRG